MTRGVIGFLVLVGGWALALYVAFYVMLYGGIMQALDGLEVDPIDRGLVVWGVIKALFFSIGLMIGWVGSLIASLIWEGA